MTAEVIDMRTDVFLRALREHGSWEKASTISGLTKEEVQSICVVNLKFDLAQTECHLENVEETMLAAIESAANKARTEIPEKMAKMRADFIEAVHRRHDPGEVVDD